MALLGALVLASGCAGREPIRAGTITAPAASPASARGDRTRGFDSASWSALSRAGHQAMLPRRFAQAEQSFVAALAETDGLPAHDARKRASLGNLVHLAAAYHRADRPEDAARLMSMVRDHLRAGSGSRRGALRVDEFDRAFLTLTRTRPSVSRRGRSASKLNPAQHDYDSLIAESAKRFDLDPALVKAVVAAESNFEVTAVSHAGAQGLMQLMPATSREMGVRAPFDPSQNLMGGSRYLRSMLDRYDDVKLALAAYNAGPEAVDRHDGVPPYPETTAYVERVLQYLEGFRGQAFP